MVVPPVTLTRLLSVAPVPTAHCMQAVAHPRLYGRVFTVEAVIWTPCRCFRTLLGTESDVQLIEGHEATVGGVDHGMIPLGLLKYTAKNPP